LHTYYIYEYNVECFGRNFDTLIGFDEITYENVLLIRKKQTIGRSMASDQQDILIPTWVSVRVSKVSVSSWKNCQCLGLGLGLEGLVHIPGDQYISDQWPSIFVNSVPILLHRFIA